MDTHTDAPGVAAPEAISTMAVSAGSGEHSNASITRLALPAHVLEALYAEGIFSLSDWSRLPRKRRHGIFGITSITAKKLDAAAREARE